MAALTLRSAYGNWKVNPENSDLEAGGEPTTGLEDHGNVETHATAMADRLTERSGVVVAVSNSGMDGKEYAWIKKDGLGGAYAHSLEAVRASVAKFGMVIVPAVVLIHGEEDAMLHTQNYADDLVELHHDYDLDIRKITGQWQHVVLYATLFSKNAALPHTTQADYERIWSSIDAAAARSPWIVAVRGLDDIPLASGDCCHFMNTGYTSLGALLGEKISLKSVVQ